jgi:hypothetical protein
MRATQMLVKMVAFGLKCTVGQCLTLTDKKTSTELIAFKKKAKIKLISKRAFSI